LGPFARQTDGRIKKAPGIKPSQVLFLNNRIGSGPLFTLSPLVARACQQLSVLVPAHFFSPFFNDTAQRITSSLQLIS
jgi:hypothetical protein